MPLDKIAKIRQKIDEVDQQIINTLALRHNLIKQIANFKDPEKIQDSKREKQIIAGVIDLGEQKNLDSKFIKKLYIQILSESKKQIKNILKK